MDASFHLKDFILHICVFYTYCLFFFKDFLYIFFGFGTNRLPIGIAQLTNVLTVISSYIILAYKWRLGQDHVMSKMVILVNC